MSSLPDEQASSLPMTAQSARMTLGWSFEKLAKKSNVAVASVYLLERLGTAGPEDDANIWDALNKHLAERSKHAAAERPELLADPENVVRFGPVG